MTTSTIHSDDTNLMKVPLQLHSLIKVREGLFHLPNGQIHSSPLEVGHVVRRITI